MNKFISAFIIFYAATTFAQTKDTIYIKINKKFEEVDIIDFTDKVQAGSPKEKLNKSVTYSIEQMEKDSWSDTKFNFTHANYSSKAYENFGGKAPLILKKPKSYLCDKKELDINFFRTTPYLQICKTFEAENSHQQDVIIFMIDEDEIKNDSIILREVTFSRPTKQ
ncbi:hypothetical protein ACFSYG_19225 [Leeuwenhoekiella polynyae]|uniref:Uncharacterized protein n=1 Tax=Leeuwenhoekiella polynyae TaxID=1550906 RepID=A0A4Q0PER9_9FLAO|nr:hypothetical protein [Leeuwenhoekiella polynyae]RXG25323.1 hypothetical protein DSM02_1293 [Leeuwenhoekiella polynyae]